ncbi:MAG TPA: glycosyltransferase family 1 protein [Thermoanaerobaculia bacterium]
MRIGIDARKIADYGIGTYIRGLLGGLAEIAGDEQYVVFAPSSARSRIPAAFEHVVLDAPHYSIRELFAVGAAARRARIDLLHAPHYVVPFTRVPTVVTIHDLIHLHVGHRNPLAGPYARTMLRRAVNKSIRILTVTEAVKNEIVATFGIPAAKVTVTRNGIDDRFRQAAQARPSNYFLYTGNDKPHKNVDVLVAAFESVRASRSDLALVLAGASFERFATVDGVVTPGFVADDELASLYRGAIAVVMPSIEEGFGLPAAEAMASGVAVITSNAPALVEVTGDAAIHVDARSSGTVAAAMLRVANDESLRTRLAGAGIDRSRAFTWLRCAESTRRAYFGA